VRIGIHTSISGALENAALEAAELGANTFQIFSTSPRMWRASVPSPVQIKLLQNARERFDLTPLAIHANYLINLASSSDALRQLSVGSFRAELQRAIAIGAEYLVVHPGSAKGHTAEEGIVAVVRSLAEASNGLDTRGVTVLLENTVGAGGHLGGRFEELALIRRCAAGVMDLRVGFCIDTCHCHSAGYDMATAKGLAATIAQIETHLGIENVGVIHTNDSKSPLGSHVDRHANIGEGSIGEDGFRRILCHPKLRNKPFILETPVDDEGDDRRNVETLKRLSIRSRRSPKPQSR